MIFSSPIVGGHLTIEKRHVFTIPNKGHQELPGIEPFFQKKNDLYCKKSLFTLRVGKAMINLVHYLHFFCFQLVVFGRDIHPGRLTNMEPEHPPV